MKETIICSICGREEDPSHWSNENEMRENQMCFECNLWHERAEKFKTLPEHEIAIIDGVYYSIDDEDSKSPFRGFGGARFQIEFNDGYKVVSTNLWCGGDIPEIWQN